jgi:hypothetical protein
MPLSLLLLLLLLLPPPPRCLESVVRADYRVTGQKLQVTAHNLLTSTALNAVFLALPAKIIVRCEV